jgi:hypothetical protein
MDKYRGLIVKTKYRVGETVLDTTSKQEVKIVGVARTFAKSTINGKMETKKNTKYIVDYHGLVGERKSKELEKLPIKNV